ncbi:MAG: hypothetical protein ACRC5H_07135 [Treponemataceae bacterium]
MKTIGNIFKLVIFVGFFIGCQNPTLPSPNTDSSDGGPNSSGIGNWGAPSNFKVTHGLKRRVELEWNQVRGAVKYAVYSSDSPFNSFSLAVESTDTKATIQEEAGVLKYYKVHAIDAYNTQSDFSRVVHGSSLAIPQITFIEPANQNATNTMVVEWLMSNFVSGITTYENANLIYELFYTLKNDPGATPIAVNPPITNKERVFTVTNLSANTEYLFRVRAYVLSENETWENRESSDNFEDSYWMDSETARKMRPDAPANLMASTGMYKDKIVVKWETPEEIEIKENDVFVKKSLFFKIYRSIAGTENYEVIESRFDGLDQMGGFYKQGMFLTYEDTSDLRSDVLYEYKVQSYGDSEGEPTASDSFATVNAWKLMPLHFLDVKNSSAFSPATLTFESSAWSNISSENEKDIIFSLQVKKTAIFDGTYENEGEAYTNLFLRGGKLHTEDDQEFIITIPYDQEVNYYQFLLTGEYAQTHDYFTSFDVISQVSNTLTLTTTIKPDPNFLLKMAGYTDKVVFSFNDERANNVNYQFLYKEVNESDFTIVSDVSSFIQTDPLYGTHLVYTGLARGKEYVCKLRANNNGLIVESEAISFATLGMPKLESFYDATSYENINFNWEKVVGASSYVIRYKYADAQPIDYTITSENSSNVSGVYTASIFLENDSKNARMSGLPLEVVLIATGNTETNEISESVITNLLGPAATDPKASKAESGTVIEVSWNKVSGANGYKIHRYKNNSATAETYFYDDIEKKTYLLGSSVLPEDTVSVTPLLADGRGRSAVSTGFLLKDSHQPKAKIVAALKDPAHQGQEGSYPFNQSQLRWGNTYTYKIIPVLKNADQIKYDISDVPSDEGYVLGYGQNVMASKGNTDVIIHTLDKSLIGEPLNSADTPTIKLTWDPPKGGEKDASYFVWRRQKNDSGNWGEWGNVTPSAILVNYYDDVVDTQGRIYEYLIETVALRDSAKPSYDSDFIEEEAKSGNNSGFLYSPPTVKISRTERPMIEDQYPELVTWTSSSIQGLQAEGINYMVSGYVIESKNLNNSADWLVVADIPLADNEKTASSFNHDMITYGYDGTRENPYGDKTHKFLRVLRDYKHYYRVRAYREFSEHNEEGAEITKRVYSQASAENWGARQINNLEFTKAALIGMSTGMFKERGTRGSDKDGDGISGLKSITKYQWSALDYKMTVTYTNYRASHVAKGGGEVSAVTVNGALFARGGLAGAYQTHYWTGASQYIPSGSSISVTYLDKTGTLVFHGKDEKSADEVSRTKGTIDVSWLGLSITYDMGNKAPLFTLPFAVTGGYLNDTEEWQ